MSDSGGQPRTAGTSAGGQDQTESRAGSTHSDTNLRLKQKKICLRAKPDPSTIPDIYIDDKGDTRKVKTLKATTRC